MNENLTTTNNNGNVTVPTNFFITTQPETNLSGTITVSGSTLWFGNEQNKTILDFKPIRVTFSGLTTVVFWSDNTKTLVRCGDMDIYDREHAVALAIAHKMFGSKHQFKKFVAGGYNAMTVSEDESRQRIKAEKKKLEEQDDFPF